MLSSVMTYEKLKTGPGDRDLGVDADILHVNLTFWLSCLSPVSHTIEALAKDARQS